MRSGLLHDLPTDSSFWQQRVRPENRIHEMSLPEKAGYLWKYLVAPQLRAPDRILKHFSQQRILQAYLNKRIMAPAESARIAFAGDLMWIRSHWNSFLSSEAQSHLLGIDGIVANLETMISSRFPVREFLPDILRFNSDPQLVRSFRNSEGKSLFAALGLANNHALDLADDGALDTLAFLEEEQIVTSGLSLSQNSKTWASFSRQAIKFGFFAASFGLNDRRSQSISGLKLNIVPGLAPGVSDSIPDLSSVLHALKEMKESSVDIKIVYLHWGSEFELYPTTRMMRVARALVEGGADFVVGSHPHVPHPMEILFVDGFEKRFPDKAQSALASLRAEGDSLISTPSGVPRMAAVIYSLGNFTTAMFTFLCRSALLVELRFFREWETGLVRWTPPMPTHFFNQQPRLGIGRSLLPLDTYLESIRGTKRFRREAEMAEFLRAHVSLRDSDQISRISELP